nr:DNA-directed RNA polymerase III subunit RPC8 [Ipomoea batatas]
MFYLSEIEHTLRLPPHLLNLALNEAIKGELEGLFVDKVIAQLGLCISVYDIRSIDGGFIFPGDGASTYTGEVIAARLKESNAQGLRLSLGFFDDIYVPAVLMPNPSHSEPDPESRNQVRWIWEYEGEKYPIDGTDEIRFRVLEISYPSLPLNQDKDAKPFAPMLITGSLDADGLGPVSWPKQIRLRPRSKRPAPTRGPGESGGQRGREDLRPGREDLRPKLESAQVHRTSVRAGSAKPPVTGNRPKTTNDNRLNKISDEIKEATRENLNKTKSNIPCMVPSSPQTKYARHNPGFLEGFVDGLLHFVPALGISPLPVAPGKLFPDLLVNKRPEEGFCFLGIAAQKPGEVGVTRHLLVHLRGLPFGRFDLLLRAGYPSLQSLYLLGRDFLDLLIRRLFLPAPGRGSGDLEVRCGCGPGRTCCWNRAARAGHLLGNILLGLAVVRRLQVDSRNAFGRPEDPVLVGLCRDLDDRIL